MRQKRIICWTRNKENSPLEDADDNLLFGFPRSVATPLAVLLFSQFVLFIGVGAVIPSIPLYGKEIGLSSASNGIIISAPAVALFLGSKFGGNFADIARKPAMILGMVVIAASDAGTACATGLGTLVIARLGLGAGRCISESGERGMLADLGRKVPEIRGRALAAQQAVVSIGIAIGAPLGGLVIEEYGPRAAFLCVTAAALVTLVIYFFLPETIEIDPDQEKVGKITNMESSLLSYDEDLEIKIKDDPRDEWLILLSQKEWRGLALCQCGVSFGFAAKIACIPILATSILPGGATAAGALISAAGLSGLIGAPLGGWLTDKTNAKLTAIICGTVSAIGLLLIPIAISLPEGHYGNDALFAGQGIGIRDISFFAAVIIWSLGATAQGPALTALAQQLAPMGREATALALPKASGDGTYIIAPFLLGLVTDSVSSIPGAECAVAGTAMLLGVIALFLLFEEDFLSVSKDSI